MLAFDVNWAAIVVCIVVNMIIGAVWYGPLFGKRWMEGLGKTAEDIQSGPMWQPYLIAVINSFLMAFVLANAVAWSGATGVAAGLLLGLTVWIGFTGFTFAANHAFESRSLQLWSINAGIYLVGLMVMGAILAVWY